MTGTPIKTLIVILCILIFIVKLFAVITQAKVEFKIQDKNNYWQSIAKSQIDKMARTATFRIENWDSSKDTPYRLAYQLYEGNGNMRRYFFPGVIRKEPGDQEEIAIAAFTGNNDLGFPNNDIIRQLKHHDPDLLFFSGDQIYEGVGGYGAQRVPVEKACLDYLRKWCYRRRYLPMWRRCRERKRIPMKLYRSYAF